MQNNENQWTEKVTDIVLYAKINSYSIDNKRKEIILLYIPKKKKNDDINSVSFANIKQQVYSPNKL